MKKIFGRILIALAALMTLCAFAAAEESTDLLKTIQERGYITIATEGDWAPWTYHDEDNNLVGLDVELGQAIAEKLGVEARFEETGWDAILAGVDSGRFDIACNGVSYTEERAEKYNFSTPYVVNKVVLVVRGDNEEITSFEDLNGKTTTNTVSSIYAEMAEGYGATVIGVDALADTIQLVLQGRADATVNSQVSINDYMLEHPEANLKIVAEVEGDVVCIPVRKSDETATLMDAINAALEEMREDGSLKALSEKYFNGLDLTGTTEE